MATFSKIATLGDQTVGVVRKAKHQSRVCKLDSPNETWLVATAKLTDLRSLDDVPTPAKSSSVEPPQPPVDPPQPEAPRIELKNVKIAANMSQETIAFTASVWVNGRQAGSASNQGCGGHTMGHLAPEVDRLVTDYCASLPPRTYTDIPGREFPIRVDDFIDTLLNEHQDRQWAKRQCRNKTLFRLHGDDLDSYRTVNRSYSPQVKDFLVGKYGDQIEVILNETL